MRKVKTTVVTKVPGWHFCNLDKIVTTIEPCQEKCRFCQKIKGGYKCILYDEYLSSTPTLVDKTPRCIEATVNGSVEIADELPSIDPKELIRSALKEYTKTVSGLMAQGYPQYLAEQVAMKYITGEENR